MGNLPPPGAGMFRSWSSRKRSPKEATGGCTGAAAEGRCTCIEIHTDEKDQNCVGLLARGAAFMTGYGAVAKPVVTDDALASSRSEAFHRRSASSRPNTCPPSTGIRGKTARANAPTAPCRKAVPTGAKTFSARRAPRHLKAWHDSYNHQRRGNALVGRVPTTRSNRRGGRVQQCHTTLQERRPRSRPPTGAVLAFPHPRNDRSAVTARFVLALSAGPYC